MYGDDLMEIVPSFNMVVPLRNQIITTYRERDSTSFPLGADKSWNNLPDPPENVYATHRPYACDP